MKARHLIVVGATLTALLLTASPLAGPAAAADGDVLSAFGTNGRTTFATGPTPEIRTVVAHTGVGPQRDVVVEHSVPSRITVTESGIVASSVCSSVACRLLPSVGSFPPFYEDGGTVVHLSGSGPIGNAYAAPPGTTLHDPQPTGFDPFWPDDPSFFVEVRPLDPTVPAYLAFSSHAVRAPVRIGEVGVPEPLVGGGFAVVSATGGLVEVRYYDEAGHPDTSRGFAGKAQNLDASATATTIRAVVAQADGGLAVLTTATQQGSAVVATTLLRFEADGFQHGRTVAGPSLTWAPRLVELPGRSVALVGTPTAPSTTTTIVRVDTAADQPFVAQPFTGGPQEIDAAGADGLGRVIVVGGTTARPRSTMTLARITPAGALDASFGTAGVVQRSLPQSTSRSFGLDVGNDSVIYAVASQDAAVLVDALIGSAPAAHRDRVPLVDLAVSTTAGAFTPLTPTRVLDTRRLGLALSADVPRRIELDTIVPATAMAVALNVTAVDPTGPGFVRVWSVDDATPETSMLNYVAGETVANATVSRLGPARALRVASHVDTDLVVDVVGYWTPSFASRSGRFVPTGPTRLLDTRDGGGAPRPDGSVTTLPIRTRTDLGLEHALAVAVTVTVADPAGPGFVTAWPGGQDRPLASSLNVNRAGELRTNMAIVGVGADGTVSLFTQRATHLVVDLVGVITDDTAPSSVHGLLQPVTPLRVDDSRLTESGRLVARKAAPSVVCGCGAAAAVYNLTAVDTAGAGYLTAYPTDRAAPLASSVNFDDAGQRRASLAVTPLDRDGQIALFANVATDYVIDLLAVIT